MLLWTAFNEVFDELLAAWRHHDELRRSPGVEYTTLIGSRDRLDDLRKEANRLRRAFAPAEKELGGIAFAVYCDVFEQSVFIDHGQVSRGITPTVYTCVCGGRAVVPSPTRREGVR